MATLTAHTKNEIASQRDIFRLAAAIYSESSNAFQETETQLEIIKCVFVASENEYMVCSELAAKVLDMYKYHISEDEIVELINNTRGVFIKGTIDTEDAYKLTTASYNDSLRAQEKNIDYYINAFISENSIKEPEKCKSAIHQYLYELTTTNINSYYALLKGKNGFQFDEEDISVELAVLGENERHYIHDFLAWDNQEKNITLSNLVYCCLEYCLLVNGDSPNSIIKNFIRRREIYLDTNIIFRALGINGGSRKKVVIAFIEKCKQAKIRIIITGVTKKEFFDTIEYYASQIARFPKGSVYAGAYEQISDYNIYAFYEDWYKDHRDLSVKYFINYVKALYFDLIKKSGIVDGENIPPKIFNSDHFKSLRNSYSASIKNVKQKYRDTYVSDDDRYSLRDSHDATVIRYIETLREQCNDPKDIFLVSTDKILRFWDINRNSISYPIVIYPSQLFLILLKTCGRSQDDYDCFVSFINIRSKSKQISPEKAHIILSGISSITEDIQAQEHLVSAVFDDEFQNIIKHSTSDEDLYRKIQSKSQNYLNNRLMKSQRKVSRLEESLKKKDGVVAQLQSDLTKKDESLSVKIEENERTATELEQTKDNIASFAEKKTRMLLAWKCTIFPIVLLILTIAFALFVFLQFAFSSKEWNCVVPFIQWVKSTPFGQAVGDALYAIDLAIAAALGFALKKWMTNPFNSLYREKKKEELIQHYLEKNKLE